MAHKRNLGRDANNYREFLTPADVLRLRDHYSAQWYFILSLVLCILPIFSFPIADFIFRVSKLRDLFMADYDRIFDTEYAMLQQFFLRLLKKNPIEIFVHRAQRPPIQYVPVIEYITPVVFGANFDSTVHALYNPPAGLGRSGAAKLYYEVLVTGLMSPGRVNARLHAAYNNCIYAVLEHTGSQSFPSMAMLRAIHLAVNFLITGCLLTFIIKRVSPFFSADRAIGSDAVTDLELKVCSYVSVGSFFLKLFFLYLFSAEFLPLVLGENDMRYMILVMEKITNKNLYIFIALLALSLADIYRFARFRVQQFGRVKNIAALKSIAAALPIALIEPAEISSTALIVPSLDKPSQSGELSISLLKYLFAQAGIRSEASAMGLFVPLQFITTAQISRLQKIFDKQTMAMQQLQDFVTTCREALADHLRLIPIYIGINPVTSKVVFSLIVCDGSSLRELREYLLANGCSKGSCFADLIINDFLNFSIEELLAKIKILASARVVSTKTVHPDTGYRNVALFGKDGKEPPSRHQGSKKRCGVAPEESPVPATPAPKEQHPVTYNFTFTPKLQRLLDTSPELQHKVSKAKANGFSQRGNRLQRIAWLVGFNVELTFSGRGDRFFGNVRRDGDLVTCEFTHYQSNHLGQK
jgi:hypothetical protein